MGEISKFQNPDFLKFDLKTCRMPTKYINNFKFKWSIVLRQTENKSEKLL